MDLLSWLTEHLVEELEHINKELVRVETYSERVELRRLKKDISEELHKRQEQDLSLLKKMAPVGPKEKKLLNEMIQEKQGEYQ